MKVYFTFIKRFVIIHRIIDIINVLLIFIKNFRFDNLMWCKRHINDTNYWIIVNIILKHFLFFKKNSFYFFSYLLFFFCFLLCFFDKLFGIDNNNVDFSFTFDCYLKFSLWNYGWDYCWICEFSIVLCHESIIQLIWWK